MTINQSEETKELANEAVSTEENGRLAKIIQDPFASMYLAATSVAVAFMFVVGGSALVSVALS